MLISPAYAQAANTAAAPDGFTALIVNVLPLVLIFAVFWFLVFRPQQQRAKAHAAKLAAVGRATPDALGRRVEVLGPAPAPIARLRGRFRFRVLLRAKDRGPLRAVVERVAAAREALDRQVRAAIDIDPVSML